LRESYNGSVTVSGVAVGPTPTPVPAAKQDLISLEPMTEMIKVMAEVTAETAVTRMAAA